MQVCRQCIKVHREKWNARNWEGEGEGMKKNARRMITENRIKTGKCVNK
jgi:hypothetical protein